MKYRFILSMLGSVLALISWALWNGFPLIYSDTGTYIATGFNKFIPVDRPYFYGFFIRHTSMGFTIWFTVIAQALVVWYAIRVFMTLFVNRNYADAWTFLSCTLLSAVTGLGYFTVLLIPDIYCAVAVLLAIVMLLRPSQLAPFNYLLIGLIYLFSLIVHFSTALLMTGVGFTLVLFSLIPWVKTQLPTRRTVRLWLFTLLSFPLALYWNHSLEKKWILSKGSNLFIAARMMETGALRIYLDHACREQPFTLCERKEDFPEQAYKFLWFMDESPLYDSACLSRGWGSCWEEKNSEYGQMAKGLIGYGPSLKHHIAAVWRDAWKQLILFDVGMLDRQGPGSPPHDQVKDQLHGDLKMYEESKQGKETLYFPVITKIQNWVIIISLAALLGFFFLAGRVSVAGRNRAVLVFGMLALFLVANAFVTSLFSTFLDRYEARLIWLLPLLLIAAASSFFPQVKHDEK